MNGIVIVGTGQAGVQLADSLRASGYTGPITMLGDEVHLPYQRPPLSKDFLAEETGEALPLRAERFFIEHDVRLLRGMRVESIDREARTVTASDGTDVPYDVLVLATGARNRVLDVPGSGLDGIHSLRTLDDAESLQAAIPAATRAVVIGAGFIGLEFAASARKRGLEVTVIDFADRPMQRVLSPEMSNYFHRIHEAAGIRLVFNEGVSGYVGDDGRVTGVVGSSSTVYPADLVVVGVGVVPDIELARAAGLEVGNGIVVDAQLRTSDPAVYAIGDCCLHPSPHADEPLRLESVPNAADQARYLGRRLAGTHSDTAEADAGYASLPWFWSQQGDRKLQIAGLSIGADLRVTRGDPDGAFSVYAFRNGALVSVESVNNPGEHMAARKALAGGIPVDPTQVADPAFKLKDLAAAS